MDKDIEDIKAGLLSGKFKNEAAVSQGIILRLLNCLGWPIFDSSQVTPEYSAGRGRVDYALCCPPNKPVILIESKDIGKADGSEKQLFEYAFHQGIPMAVLTDGQEWSFFLPGEQGSYHERCVYKLDLNARTTSECCSVLKRYLKQTEVASGAAFENARNDYKNVSKRRQIKEVLPRAWNDLISEQDEFLVELIAEKVESLCGFKPDPDEVRTFLDKLQQPQNHVTITTPRPQVHLPTAPQLKQRTVNTNDHYSGFYYKGKEYREGNAIKTMLKVFEVLASEDNRFLQNYADLPKHGRKRRYLARNKMELYPCRPDLCQEYSQEIFPGWWVGTNYSRSTIRNAVMIACEVSGLKFDHDLKLI